MGTTIAGLGKSTRGSNNAKGLTGSRRPAARDFGRWLGARKAHPLMGL